MKSTWVGDRWIFSNSGEQKNVSSVREQIDIAMTDDAAPNRSDEGHFLSSLSRNEDEVFFSTGDSYIKEVGFCLDLPRLPSIFRWD